MSGEDDSSAHTVLLVSDRWSAYRIVYENTVIIPNRLLVGYLFTLKATLGITP